jgi:hypothetical protein
MTARKNCPHCAKSTERDEELKKKLKRLLLPLWYHGSCAYDAEHSDNA